MMKKLICLLLALVMLMTMTACNNDVKKMYQDGVAAYNAGDYENAAVLLYIVGDYQDAAQLLATIQAEKTGVTTTIETADGTVTTTTEYIYKNGNLIKETVTHADGTVTKNYYKYNDNGLCTSETLNGADGGKTVINHFYEDGIKIRSIRTNPDNSKDTYEYTCDGNGRILTHVLTLADGTVEEATYTYSDATGWLVSIETANTKTVFSYDHFNNVSNAFVNVDGQDVSETSYHYQYNCSVG